MRGWLISLNKRAMYCPRRGAAGNFRLKRSKT